jgi:hypothetical protein
MAHLCSLPGAAFRPGFDIFDDITQHLLCNFSIVGCLGAQIGTAVNPYPQL